MGYKRQVLHDIRIWLSGRWNEMSPADGQLLDVIMELVDLRRLFHSR
jgi:hypothetical protein